MMNSFNPNSYSNLPLSTLEKELQDLNPIERKYCQSSRIEEEKSVSETTISENEVNTTWSLDNLFN
uniref:Uncharacterized protein n=1 Tax=Heterorhabditis bacteriophora TaxID=37862 RepID=A0A1I7XG79_HETBA